MKKIAELEKEAERYANKCIPDDNGNYSYDDLIYMFCRGFRICERKLDKQKEINVELLDENENLKKELNLSK